MEHVTKEEFVDFINREFEKEYFLGTYPEPSQHFCMAFVDHLNDLFEAKQKAYADEQWNKKSG